MFELYSWYFRNALVRANYRNVQIGINAEPIFLIRFFRNLLLGENNELKNRYMIINPPEELKTPTSTPASTPTSSDQDLLQTDNSLIRNLVKIIGNNQCSIKDMLEGVGLKDRKNFLEYHLNPAIAAGYVRQLYPQSPRHPRQRYLLTVKGQILYQEITT